MSFHCCSCLYDRAFPGGSAFILLKTDAFPCGAAATSSGSGRLMQPSTRPLLTRHSARPRRAFTFPTHPQHTHTHTTYSKHTRTHATHTLTHPHMYTHIYTHVDTHMATHLPLPHSSMVMIMTAIPWSAWEMCFPSSLPPSLSLSPPLPCHHQHQHTADTSCARAPRAVPHTLYSMGIFQDFKTMVAAAHAAGIRVFLDVTTHGLVTGVSRGLCCVSTVLAACLSLPIVR